MKRPGGFDTRAEDPGDSRGRRRGAPTDGGSGADATASAPEPLPERTAPRQEAPAGPGASTAPAGELPDPPEHPDQSETVDLGELGRGAGWRALVRGGAARSVRHPEGGVLSRFSARQRDIDPVRAAERRLRQAERRNKQRQRRETQRFTAAARRTRRRILIAGGAVAALVAFVLLGAFTPLMAVSEVRVEGAQNVDAAEVAQALTQFEGVPLALVDENAVLRSLESFPRIQRFAVERVPPHTLVVRVEERVPVVALEHDGAFRTYDAAGVLVAESDTRPEGMPAGGDGLRNTSSRGFLAATKVLRDMPAELRGQVASVNSVSGQDVTLQLGSGVEVFWGNPDETKRKSLVLQTMLGSLQDRQVTLIDVSSTEAPIFK